MANIHIKREHSLPSDEVRLRIDKLARDLQKKLDADYRWEGDSLRFKRSGASGTIDMGDGFVELNLKLSMMLAPLKGKIEQTIQENIEVALADNGESRMT